MRGYPALGTLVTTLQHFYAQTSEPGVVSVEELYGLYHRDPSEIDRNKTWLRNKLTPFKYHRLVKTIHSPEGRLMKVALTQRGKEMLEGFRSGETIGSAKTPTESYPPAISSRPLNTDGAPNRVLYPFPLLDGQLIHISLPVKLSKEDAKRIAVFIENIAIELPQASSETDHE